MYLIDDELVDFSRYLVFSYMIFCFQSHHEQGGNTPLPPPYTHTCTVPIAMGFG